MLSSPPAVARFLLARPDVFDVTYEINPFMDASVPVDHERALAQWASFRDRLTGAGASVEELPAAPACPDFVYAANAALVIDGRALLTRFLHPQRQPEVEHNRAGLERLGIEVHELPDDVGAFEGSADAMPLQAAGAILTAWGPRTSRDVLPHVAEFAGMRGVEVHLHDERFYHLDLAVCPLDQEHALVVPEAMSPDSYARFREVVPNPLELTLEEGLGFCSNSVVVGHTVFMHQVPARVRAMLADAGFTAVEASASEFVKGGGSLACMALRIDRTSRLPAG